MNISREKNCVFVLKPHYFIRQTQDSKSALDKTQQQDCKKQWSYWSLYCNVGVVLKLDLCRLAVEQAVQFMEMSLQMSLL